jgi:hypothetical protein
MPTTKYVSGVDGPEISEIMCRIGEIALGMPESEFLLELHGQIRMEEQQMAQDVEVDDAGRPYIEFTVHGQKERHYLDCDDNDCHCTEKDYIQHEQ